MSNHGPCWVKPQDVAHVMPKPGGSLITMRSGETFILIPSLDPDALAALLWPTKPEPTEEP